MARPRSPNRDKAFKLYKRYKGQIANKEIAKILEEDPKTVSKWKTLDKWEHRVNNSKLKKRGSKNIQNDTSYPYAKQEIEVLVDLEKEIHAIREVDDCNEKQLLFCIYYTKYFNASKAYKKAYGCEMTTARVNGCKLLSNPNIQATIQKLKQNKMNRAMLSPDDIFQKYMDIAFADVTDFIEFGNKEVQYIDDLGAEKSATVSTINIKNDFDVDGTLICEVSKGKDGVKVKLADRMKALQWLSEHMDIATEEQKARVESLRNKVRVENESLELRKKEFERNDW